MMRISRLTKGLIALLCPSLLTAFIAIQIYSCRLVFDRRNSYLLETLPFTSEKVWDALSGNLSPLNLSTVNVQDQFAHPKSSYNSLTNGASISNGQLQQERKLFREAVLQPGLPSLTVHFLWCVDGIFELNQYITVMSILHRLRPDKIIIHYRVKPRSDPHGYWRWLEDLERDIVILSLRPLKDFLYCSHDFSSGLKVKDFSDPHSVFILGDVVLIGLTRPDIVNLMISSFTKNVRKSAKVTSPSFEQLSQSKVFLVSEIEPFHVSQSPGRAVISCPSNTHFNRARNISSIPCVSMESYISMDELYHRETNFLNYVRLLIYGSKAIIDVNAVIASSHQIPKIVHIILDDDDTEISPLMYLSIKSAYVTGKVERVFLHSHIKPKGQLWDKLVLSDHLEPKHIPTAKMKQSNSKQAINSYLLYTLLQHGGIATRGDVIFLKPVSSMPLQASAITTIRKSQYRQKHRSLNTAVIAASSGSEFVKSVLGMIYQPQQPHVAPVLDEIATHVSELIPNSVMIDTLLTTHLNCHQQMCIIAGGHDSTDRSYTTKFFWTDGRQPKTLNKILSMEGPQRSFLSNLVCDTCHF